MYFGCFLPLCGYMVTVVTVTFLIILAAISISSCKGLVLVLAGEKPKRSREKKALLLSFAYTQTTVCLYANDCAPVPNFNRYISVTVQKMDVTNE